MLSFYLETKCYFKRKQLQNSVQKLSQTSHNLKNHFSRMKCFLKESLFALGNPDVTNRHSIMGNHQKKNCPNPSHYFDHNFTISHIFQKISAHCATSTSNMCACVVYYKNREFAIVDGHWLRNPQSIQQMMTIPFFYTKRVSHNPVQLRASRTHRQGLPGSLYLPIFSF